MAPVNIPQNQCDLYYPSRNILASWTLNIVFIYLNRESSHNLAPGTSLCPPSPTSYPADAAEVARTTSSQRLHPSPKQEG